MSHAPSPGADALAVRARALAETALLDQAPEPAFDRITALVRRLLDVPVALVSFVDRDRQFFVSQDGLAEPWASARETPLTHSFCQHVVAREAPLVVEDATRDPEFCGNLAIRDLDVVGYLGVPVRGPSGAVLGSLCAITSEPRAWSLGDVEAMESLGAIVETEVALRTALREAEAEAQERREADLALQRSEDRLEFVLMVAGLGEWELDLETGRATRSPLHDQIFGYPSPLPEWTYEMFLDHVVPEDRDRVDAAFQEAIVGGAEWDLVCRIQRADGANRWIGVRGRSWLSEYGDPRRMVGTVIDITDRWQAQEALRKSEARFRQLADTAPALLWVADADGQCTFLSQSWTEFTGQAETDGQGLGWLEMVHPEDRPRTEAAFLEAAAAGAVFRVDYRLRYHDGTYRWALDTGRPRVDATGAFAGYVGSVIDIHNRKQAEARTSFLAATGRLIEKALDYEATLREIAHLAVPEFSDWCAIDLLRADGSIEPVAITHPDPERVAWGRELRERYPLTLDAPSGVPRVIRTGEPEFYPAIPDEVLVASAQDEEHLRLMRSVGFESAVVVPMRAGGEVTGALTFVHAESGRHFMEADVEAAEEVARRAGAALEMARLHAALREREARYRTLFESIDVGFCVLEVIYEEGRGGDYRFAETNPTFVAQSGLEDPEGKTVREVVPDFPLERVAVYAAVAETGQPARFVREVEETGRWYEIYATRIGGAGSANVAVFSTDVTERRLAEEALRESEARFRLLAETATDVILTVDDTWVIQYVNGAAAEVLGYTPADLIGAPLITILPVRFQEAHLAGVDRYLDSGERTLDWSRVEVPGRRKDGAEVPLAISFGEYTAADRRYFTAIIRDVSAQQEAEQALRESEARFRGTFENAAVGIAHVGLDGTWLQVNRRMSEIVGYTREEFLARTFQDITHPDDLDADVALFERLLAGEIASYHMEKRYVHREGHTVWINLTVAPERMPDGEVAYLISVVEDISEKKAAEAALRALNEELEDRVAARTAEFERSNAELDQFAYVASHDLKAPLRAIDSLATWIAEDVADVLPAESSRHLALLRGRVSRMEGLLDSLLTYSRAGRQPAAPEPVDTGALVRAAVALVAPPDGMRVEVEGAFPMVETARSPLELVVRNLVGNAIKHHDRPDGRVTVSARTDGDWAEFSVADDGPGIVPEYQARVFGLFQTLRPRDEVEGSGMGLAIVKKTVEGRGGAVTLESDGHRGTTFRFTWPLRAHQP